MPAQLHHRIDGRELRKHTVYLSPELSRRLALCAADAEQQPSEVVSAALEVWLASRPAPVVPLTRGAVYFAQVRGRADSAIKIGWSADVRRRLDDLATASPEPLTIIAALPGGRDLEARMHARFAAHRGQGEWFEAAPVLSYLATLGEQS
jgi:predicted transcriptional regulator